MRAVRTGSEFRMKLDTNKPGMSAQFYNFDKVPLGISAGQAHRRRLKLLPVQIIEFISMPVSLLKVMELVGLLGKTALGNDTAADAESERPAEFYALLIGHQVNYRISR